MILAYAAASLTGSWRGVPVASATSVDDQLGAVRRHHVRELGQLLLAEVRVGQHGVDPEVGRVLGQHLEVVAGPNPGVSPASRPG